MFYDKNNNWVGLDSIRAVNKEIKGLLALNRLVSIDESNWIESVNYQVRFELAKKRQPRPDPLEK